MQPFIWGKYLWTSIHYISLGYPENPTNEEKNDYKLFFENIFKVIPCYMCSENYKDHLVALPITQEVLRNTKSLFTWTVQIHNIVNKTLNKKQMSVTEAYQLYTKTYITNNALMVDCFSNLSATKASLSTPNRNWLLVINILMFFIIVLLIGFIFMKRSSRKPS